MFSSLFKYVCYIIFWIFWDPLQLVFHILPMTNIVPWPQSHILDLFWRLVSASGRRYHNISVGICFWKLKRILENKILCPTCHVFLLSPICHFWMIDPLLQNMSRVAQPRLRVTIPAHQSVIWLTLLIQREKQKYFTKYSKSIHFVSPRLSHMSVTLNSVKIFINISHDKTDWQIGINIRQLYIPDKHRRKQTFVHKINKRKVYEDS